MLEIYSGFSLSNAHNQTSSVSGFWLSAVYKCMYTKPIFSRTIYHNDGWLGNKGALFEINSLINRINGY